MNEFKKALGGVVLSLAVPWLAVGCKKPVPTPDPTVTSAAASAAPAPLTRQVGDKVDVQWNGSWWKGKILAAQDGKYRVHYTGWATSWDENVAPERVRDQTADAKVGATAEPDDSAPAAASATSTATTVAVAAAPATSAKAPAATGAFAVGSKVDVNWKSAWYQGKVLSKTDTGYRVHYIGWASSWDENVPASRVRAFSGTAAKGSKPE